MRHYCNKQNSMLKNRKNDEQILRNNIDKNEEISENNRALNQDEVIFPPGVNYEAYTDADVKMSNYSPPQDKNIDIYENAQGGLYTQKSGLLKQAFYDAEKNEQYQPYQNYGLFYDNLSGKFSVLSIPQNREKPRVLETMLTYLQKFKGKYICIDLWNNESIRIEKCGYLENVDDGHIVIKNYASDEITMLDLNTIKYISIYCR